jgi:hypothetical protein
MQAVRVRSREQPKHTTMTNTTYQNWGVGLCHATGELIQDGFYLQCADLYFSTQEHLLNHLRAEYNDEGLNDKDLLEYWYATDEDERDMFDSGYYYSVWEEDEDNINYVQIDGQIIEL